MPEYKVAAIPADGIGIEVIAATKEVLAALELQVSGLEFSFTVCRLGLGVFPKKRQMSRRTGWSIKVFRCESVRRRRGGHSDHITCGDSASRSPGVESIRECPSTRNFGLLALLQLQAGSNIVIVAENPEANTLDREAGPPVP